MTPDKFTNQELMLDVGDGHQLYVHDWGNKKSTRPILSLHGGPGEGFSDGYKTSYDPIKQRVIFFDQRGSGKSLPYGSLKNNTTADLIEDIKKITSHLELDKFILAGGSWGACLALAYALKYPAKILAIVIRGIFTGSQAEIDWLETGVFKRFFPEVWDEYLSTVPSEFKSNPSHYHNKSALGSDPDKAKLSAYAVSNVESALMSLDDRYTNEKFENFDPASITTEIHYMTNKLFMEDEYILNNVHTLKMPVWLIQGRYDMVCPPETAYKLHKSLPNSQLIWTMAGHGNDRSNYDVFRTLVLQLAEEE